MTNHGVIMLDGGPGGYTTAERLGHAGKNTLPVEASLLGSICLNVGCIPTKTLLRAAKTYDHARYRVQFGMRVDGARTNWPALQRWKDKVVSTLVDGAAVTEKKAGVAVVHGHDTSDGPGKVTIDGATHTTTHVILATGSMPAIPPIPGAKGNPLVIDSTGALSLPETSKRLAVIGGGVIGMEFISLYFILGTQVTVIEMLPEIVPPADDDVAMQFRETLKDVTFKLSCRVISIGGGRVSWTTADDAEESVEADYVLMAVGHRLATNGWSAENTGLEYSGRGVVVDDRVRTNLSDVWAVGDVTGRSLPAHTTYHMGEAATANVLDPETHRRDEAMCWHTVLWVVYIAPECAGIGLTEAATKKTGRDVITTSVSGYMSGRFVAGNGPQAPGLTKLILNAETRQMLDTHVLSSYVAEMIWGAPAILETELDLTDLRQLVFPHPTVSELVREVAWTVKA